MNEWLWTEKYRPHKIDDCIIPARLRTLFKEYVKIGSVPNLLLTGGPGTGKTTVARALCEEIGLDHLFINSSEERGIDTLRVKIRTYASTMSLTGGRKVIIMDEADYLTPEAQAALRGIIEEVSINCTFVLTCNFKSRLIDAIHSRSTVVDFNLQKKEKAEVATEFYKRVQTILKTEGVEFEPSVVAKVVSDFFPDFRRTINELQRYSNFGKIDSEVLKQFSDIRNLDVLIKALKDKDFREMRKWVAQNADVDTSKIFRQIYDNLYEYMTGPSIPQAVVILGRYQYQAAFVADQEINMVACLTEIMIDCEFK